MKRLGIYERYVTAWSDVSAAERKSLLDASVSDDVSYRDNNTRRNGRTELSEFLGDFQVRQPRCTFRETTMLSWGSDALAKWQFFDAQGIPGFEGYDALTFADDGRIAGIVSFSDTEKQRLK